MSESNSGDKTCLEQELTVSKDTTEQLANTDSGMATGGPPGEVQAGMTGATRRRFQLRSTNTRHKDLEDFKTALASMELDVNPENDTVHMVLTDQLLEILEKEHNTYVVNEGLDINRDPEKCYITEKRNLLQRLRAKRKERFSRLTGPQLLPLLPERFPGEDDLGSVCSNSRFSSASQLRNNWSERSACAARPAL
jgi:hypothetical protein